MSPPILKIIGGLHMEKKRKDERTELFELLLTLTPEELAEVIQRASVDPILEKKFQ